MQSTNMHVIVFYVLALVIFVVCMVLVWLQVSRPEFVEYLCGNRVLPGSEPASHCYCGHQFRHFSGQLGDGCAQLVSHFI